jgi:HEAT repeats
MSYRNFLVVVLLLCMAGTASAGIIFGKKKPKPAPNERVPELIGVLKNDGDENKRQSAAEELRQYDSTAYPAIMPALIEALLGDKKPAVRAEAAQSLGKLRPVSQEAGQALEQALHDDQSMRVRLQARSALMQYHWAGYRATKDVPPVEAASKEPAATPPVIHTATRPAARLTPQPVAAPVAPPAVPRPTTREPPLAAPGPAPAPAKPAGEGPDLGPPN